MLNFAILVDNMQLKIVLFLKISTTNNLLYEI